MYYGTSASTGTGTYIMRPKKQEMNRTSNLDSKANNDSDRIHEDKQRSQYRYNIVV
jgi:hypothetical protein